LKQFLIRLINVMIGLFLYALGIALTVQAHIGYAPWDVFHIGLADKFGSTIGIVSIFVGMIIVIIVTFAGEKIGLGTVLNVIVIGIFLDIILESGIIPIALNLPLGVIMIVAGLFIIAIGSYFYMKSAFGTGPRDNLMVVLTKKTGMPIGICRSIVDITVTVVGWLLGGMVGAGTIIAAVAGGLCIQIVFKMLKFDVTAIKHETLFYTFASLIKKNK